jgi:peptide deformylase
MVKRTGEVEVTEGCLSIPGYRGEIKRAAKVTVKGLDRQGKQIRIKGEGLLAEALEHELDHINGILYIDHLASADDLEKVTPAEGTLEI